jgi:beta-lactamase superfamily II metal-dependent hydrolase
MPRRSRVGRDPVSERFAVHLLDVGPEEFGDAVFCQFGDKTVLIDGAHQSDARSQEGHPSIPQQLQNLTNQQGSVRVSLLIVSHTHDDHIGCLPELIQGGKLLADWALLADPALGFGRPIQPPDAATRDAVQHDPRVLQLAAALREEPRLSLDGNALLQFLDDLANLEQRYKDMLTTLEQNGTHVVRYGRDDPADLLAEFEDIGLRIIGPSSDQILICADKIESDEIDAIGLASDLFRQDATLSLVEAYRQLSVSAVDALDAGNRPGAAVNDQSLVTRFAFRNRKLLFTGDMQFVTPGVAGLNPLMDQLRQDIQQDGPYDFAKISHHGSSNAFDTDVLREMGGVTLLGLCTGVHSNQHPSPQALQVLHENAGTLTWARTDRNGLTTLNFDVDPPIFTPSTPR